ncbi:MAG: serine/threonine protein phosphatase [Enterovirga sp.]|nr:serine/threonine protein phosphatase [Enterovirga sp.]
MFKNILAKLRATKPEAVPQAPRLPEGLRVYAVGDIHGRVDLLQRMRDLIAADMKRSRPDAVQIVLLGDYVDRGPNSKGVLELLATGDAFPAPVLPLLGNHEAMLLDFLHRPESGETWRRFGGIETVHSYGVDVASFRTGTQLAATSERLRLSLPAEHLAFLHRLALSHAVGGYFFCHAGVRPGIPLDQQREEDLLWIRDEFIGSDQEFGAVVVHGHTPGEQPMVRENAIGVDTGAYITGRLTCVALEARGASFLST